MKVTNWRDCYGDGWQGIITKESFAHPAKFSKALIERIFDHCLERGWLKRGDLVGDPFGGIGNGGIVAAYRGLQWEGVELEPRFCKFARDNFDLHASKWRTMGLPMPRIVQGDSRKFHEVVSCVGIVTSPPYADSNMNMANGIEGEHINVNKCSYGQSTYGTAPGQIGRLKSGDVAAVVTSPPFSAPNMQPKIGQGHRDNCPNPISQGATEGNIETLQPGNLNAVVTSPPFEDQDRSTGNRASKGLKRDVTLGNSSIAGAYGESENNIGNSKVETYWQAMAAVYASCFTAIKPGGICAVVVKDYVSKKKRVPLCDDTARLLEHCGFEIVERVHAMLTKQATHNDLFSGTTTTTKSRKSFFRRLAEKKGSPPIDFEEVIFCKRP